MMILTTIMTILMSMIMTMLMLMMVMVNDADYESDGEDNAVTQSRWGLRPGSRWLGTRQPVTQVEDGRH